MRTAEICPTCATYQNALCIIYNGGLLTNLNIAPLDSLEAIIVKINNNVVPLTGILPPAISATYLGQQFLNTDTQLLYSARTVGLGAADWELIIKAPALGADEYANNTEALDAGLHVGDIYRTGDLLKIVH